MLRNLHDLRGYAIRAIDGDIGHVNDFYIDDEAWVIRYFVVETGSWLSSRKVLISPISIGHAYWPGKELSVTITRDQVKNSPDIDTEKPVSRQHEIDYLGYYAYPLYWGGPGLWGERTQPNLVMPEFVSTPSIVRPQVDNILAESPAIHTRGDDPHLHSCNTILSYHIHASDGEIGHVQGLLVDERTWAIRYMIVNTSNWRLGHQVLVAPQWIKDISWMDGTVTLNLSRQKIKDAPPYDPTILIDRTHEESVHTHYGNVAYWVKEQSSDAPRAVSPR